jgi:hypothetical protein
MKQTEERNMSKFKRNITLAFLGSMLSWALLVVPAEAQKLSNISASFVDIGFGARPVGMGGAYTGLADDEHSVYWNPAGLANIKQYMSSFTHTNQLRLIEYNYVALASPLPGANHGAGATIISSGDDAMRELSVHLAYAYSLGPVSAGLSLKYRNATFGNNMFSDDHYIVFEPDEISQGRMNQISGDGTGFGMDFGLMYRVSDRATFGVVLRDALAPFTWSSANQNPDRPAKGSYDEGMPMEVVFGSALRARPNLIVTTDYRPSLHKDTDDVVNIGAEMKFLNLIALRGGTEQRINTLRDEKFAVGFGLYVPIVNGIQVRLDYAYLFEQLDNTQRISLAVHF